MVILPLRVVIEAFAFGEYLLTSLRLLFVLLLLVVGASADAQVLDRIEINRIGGDAEIRIRFTTEIQYLRHVPLERGKVIRVFIRLTNQQIIESDLPQETLSSPTTDLVPRFTVTYPELINGLVVTFEQQVRFKLRPGEDAKSIVITMPVLPGAKDVSIEQRTLPAPPLAQIKPPAPAVAEPARVQALAATEVSKPVAQATAIAPVPLPVGAPTTTAAPPEKSAPAASANVAPAALLQPAVESPPVTPPLAPSSPVVAEAPPAAAAAIAPQPVLSNEEIERLAKIFFADASTAMEQKDLPKAINRLNRVLGLPPNTQTEAAQALIGQARELNGEIAKARAEYELFLKVFPKSGEVPRIKQRLAALPAQAPRQSSPLAVRPPPKDAPPAEWTVFGGFSQYWYHGQSHIETTTPPPPGQLTFNTDTLSLTDQDSLISSLDINARRRDAITDTRVVFRYIDNHNYLKRGKGYSRLNSAYFEQTERQVGYFVRAGRQNPSGGGVQERFDGLSLGYHLTPEWRVNAVAGTPVEFGLPYKKQFYGTGLEKVAQLEHPGYSFYFLTQTLEGSINRRAVGSDVRYFDSQLTLYGLFDYDIDFNDINIALMQANYRTLDNTSYFAVLDHRKTPSLSLLSSLSAFPGVSIKDILATTPIDEVRNIGKALTAESNLLSVGFTRPYSERWQFGADYRLASITGIEGAGAMPAQPGTGNNHVVSGQAIGNSVFRSNDVAVANVNLIFSPTFKGQAYGLNYVIQLLDSLRLDGSLRFYTQEDDLGEKQTRLNPSLRITYRVKNQLTLECEAGNETARTDGPTRKDRSDRRYIYFGYRWDFR